MAPKKGIVPCTFAAIRVFTSPPCFLEARRFASGTAFLQLCHPPPKICVGSAIYSSVSVLETGLSDQPSKGS